MQKTEQQRQEMSKWNENRGISENEGLERFNALRGLFYRKIKGI